MGCTIGRGIKVLDIFFIALVVSGEPKDIIDFISIYKVILTSMKIEPEYQAVGMAADLRRTTALELDDFRQ